MRRVDASQHGSAIGEAARPFLPTRDFEVALGFEMVFDSEVAIFGVGTGGSGLILQRYYQADWAGNFMMQLVVDNLDERWSEIDSLDLPKQFGIPAPKPPTIQPWGLRVAYVVDPAGVLWHVTERPAAA